MNQSVWFDPNVATTLTPAFSNHTTVDVADMEESQRVKVDVMTLNLFMEVHQFDELPSEMAGVVTYFSLGEEIKEMAETLCTFWDSYIFQVCWEQRAKLWVTEEVHLDDPNEEEVADIMATPEMMYEEVFLPCYDNYKGIYVSLKNGSIMLEKVNQLFGAYKGKYEELAQDLDIMCRVDKSTDKKWINSRVQQIEQYHELHLAVASAQIIMMVKETLNLQGDFRVLETLTEVVSGHV